MVEDDEDSRALLQALLEVNGASTVVADSAATALEQLASSRPDMLVSDIGMPGASGWEGRARPFVELLRNVEQSSLEPTSPR